MSIDPVEYREKLADNFIKLLDSERGVAAKLSKSIGKSSSFINEIRRGKPVNALHIKAVAIVFGTQEVLELMAIDDSQPSADMTFKNQTHGRDITHRLIEMEKISPKAFEMVTTYITGAHEAAKATAERWDGIERRSKERRIEVKKTMGLKSPKNGTDE